MRKNIIEIMEDKKLIEELYSKTKETEKKVLKINSHISSTEYFIAFSLGFLNFFYLIYIWNESFFKNSIDSFIMSTAFLIFIFILSLISSLLFKTVIFLFKKFILCKISKKKQPIACRNDIYCFLADHKDINNTLINFEESLTQKELEYYKAYDFFCKGNKEWFIYAMYKRAFIKDNIKILIDCKDKITEDIRENFNVYYQKRLFEDLSETIEKNTVNKELNRLNSLYNKVENRIMNPLSIENQ